ncbi:DUF4270 family protein [Cytophagales bacterium LB-30]|uniref:DUF4270 family protein n=1 Tax=Shiella aurantiaca TaxID=3058365 RepID=A0ABT8F5F7_9BACT|nr:DUF4270 family protein [Shiella aurantiaca]MDN4165717.1 DUF4270 family protein [Shiella aurantiaca]
MNLWDKTLKTGLVIVSALFTFSCEDPSELGANLQNLQNLEVQYAEIPLEGMQMRIDSMNTTNRGFLAVGRVNDPVFGSIMAESYTNLAYTPGFKLPSGAVLDSVTCYLIFNRLYAASGAPASIQLSIHELTSTFDRQSSATSNDKLEYSAILLGQKTVSFENNNTIDTTHIRLNTQISARLFAFANSEETDSSYQHFINTKLKGIAITSSEGTNGIAQIANQAGQSGILLHYHVPNGEDSLTYRFNFNYINQNILDLKGSIYVEVDRSASPLATMDGIAPNTPTDLPLDNLYLQNITGVLPVLNLNNFFAYFDTIPHAVINRADLVLGSTTTEGILVKSDPTQLITYYFTEDNDVNYFGSVQQTGRIDPSGIGAPMLLTSGATGTMNADISNFLQASFDGVINQNRLILSNTFFSEAAGFNYPRNNFDRLELIKDKIRLKVYYTIPKN